MTVTLVTEEIWPRITKLCGKGRAYVAVAYFGQGGPAQLPLSSGSVLVVDASEPAIKQGQTWPKGLLALARRGVAIYSAGALHAKVFAFQNAVVVGSTNASANSARVFQEAVVVSNNRTLIKQAREFVLDLATEPLPPSRLLQLQALYRPPRGGPKATRTGTSKQGGAVRSPLWIVDLSMGDWSEVANETADAGRPAAKKKLSEHEILDEFQTDLGQASLAPGDQVVQVTEYGKQVRVYPPATVLAVDRFRNGRQKRARSAIVFLARPAGRRSLVLSKAKARLGSFRSLVVPRASLRQVRDRAAAQAIRHLWKLT